MCCKQDTLKKTFVLRACIIRQYVVNKTKSARSVMLNKNMYKYILIIQ